MTKPVTTAHLTEMLQDARSRTLELLQGLDRAQLKVPQSDNQLGLGPDIFFSSLK